MLNSFLRGGTLLIVSLMAGVHLALGDPGEPLVLRCLSFHVSLVSFLDRRIEGCLLATVPGGIVVSGRDDVVWHPCGLGLLPHAFLVSIDHPTVALYFVVGVVVRSFLSIVSFHEDLIHVLILTWPTTSSTSTIHIGMGSIFLLIIIVINIVSVFE